MNTSVRIFLAALVAALAMLNVPSTMAQTFTGSLTLGSQAEVDAFNYSEVTGSLTISGDDIVSLDPLSSLTTLGSYLSLGANPGLDIVDDAFPNLTSVGGGIAVYNTHLVTLDGFDALLGTGDTIDFWFNDSLVAVTGFGSLQTAGWSLEFGANPLLTEIPEFESLEVIPSSLFILDNLSLTEITGFNALLWVDWSFQINDNALLSNFCGFYNYFSANNPYTGGGAFNIDGNSPDLPESMTIDDVLDAGPCVVSPLELIEQLIADISALDLSKGVKNKLLKSLANVRKSLESDKFMSALNQLEALAAKIEFLALRGKIGADTAADLVDAVLAIMDAINS